MAMLIADAKPGIFKPRGALAIDRSHPLTRGLAFAVLFGNAVPVDLVKGYASTPSGVSIAKTITLAEPGWGVAFNAPASGHHIFSGAINDAQYLGAITIVWRGVITTTGVFSDLVQKTASNGATNCPFDFRTDNSSPPKLTLVRSNAATSDAFSGSIPSTTIGVVQTYGVTNTGANGAGATTYYINGAPTVSSTAGAAAPYTGTSQPIWVGRRQDGIQLNGNCLCCYIWARVLTPTEMLLIHKTPYAFIISKGAIPSVASTPIPISAIFRRSLSSVGTRVGARQAQIGG